MIRLNYFHAIEQSCHRAGHSICRQLMPAAGLGWRDTMLLNFIRVAMPGDALTGSISAYALIIERFRLVGHGASMLPPPRNKWLSLYDRIAECRIADVAVIFGVAILVRLWGIAEKQASRYDALPGFTKMQRRRMTAERFSLRVPRLLPYLLVEMQHTAYIIENYWERF